MKLSRTERWILANQYRILAGLFPDDRETYEKFADALEEGYSAYIDHMAEHIYDEGDIVTDEQCSFVLQTMSMYEALQRGFEQHSPQTVRETEVRFPGFDGNNETPLMGYARFVIDREHRFTHLDRNQDLNSHMPSVAIYQRMLERWKALNEKYDLSEAEMREVLDARIHPSNRP
jgi:uncharacterized protein